MIRLHPQDLRAIVAALAYMDPEANSEIARSRADHLLAELERTAKPNSTFAESITHRPDTVTDIIQETEGALLLRLAVAMEARPMGNGFDREDWLDAFRSALEVKP